jgi:hypothetical protein
MELHKLKGRGRVEWTRETPGNPVVITHPVLGVRAESANLYRGRVWGLRTTLPNSDKNPEKIETARVQLCASENGGRWEVIGELPVDSRWPQAPPGMVLPLEGDRFLGVLQNPILERGKSSYFVTYKLDSASGKIEFNELCDMGLPGELLIPNKASKSSALRNPKFSLLQYIGLEMRAAGSIRTEDYICFLMPSTGLVWVFDGGKGYLKGLHPLYGKILSSLDRPERIESAVVQWQARPDGHILLASRTEKAVFEARAHYRTGIVMSQPTEAELKDPAKLEELSRLQAKIVEGGFLFEPELQWWDFNPATGKFTREDAPAGAPVFCWNAEEWEGLKFEHRKNGTLKIDGPASNRATDIQSQASKGKK